MLLSYEKNESRGEVAKKDPRASTGIVLSKLRKIVKEYNHISSSQCDCNERMIKTLTNI